MSRLEEKMMSLPLRTSIGLLALFTTTLGAPAAVPPQFMLTQIPIPSNSAIGVAFGVNDNGWVVGYLDVGNRERAFVFHDGAMTVLDPSGSGNARAEAVNNANVVVGTTDLGGGPPYTAGFQWSSADGTRLLQSSTNSTSATTINSSGTIGGRSGSGSVRWAPGSITPSTVPFPTGFQSGSYLEGINTSSVTAGWAIGTNGLTAWRHSPSSGLQVLSGPSVGDSMAYDINDAGVVAGYANLLPARWTGTTYQELPVSPLHNSGQAYSINNAGDLVGYSYGASARAAFWRNGEYFDLTTLVAPSSLPTGWVLLEANEISNSGYIVGRAADQSGRHVPFLLTPVPAPGSSAMLLLWSVAAFKRRR